MPCGLQTGSYPAAEINGVLWCIMVGIRNEGEVLGEGAQPHSVPIEA